MIKQKEAKNMNQKLTRQFGRRLKEVRLHLRLNQRQFARKIEISNTYLSSLEAGKNAPGFNFFFKLTRYSDINPFFLLHGQQPLFLKKTDEAAEAGVLREQKKAEADKQEKESIQHPDSQKMQLGENTQQVQEMLEYFRRSPVVRYSVLGFYSKFVIENKEVISEDIKNQAVDTKEK
jgi:transcriptional regulator with XRE-family HTH domain